MDGLNGGKVTTRKSCDWLRSSIPLREICWMEVQSTRSSAINVPCTSVIHVSDLSFRPGARTEEEHPCYRWDVLPSCLYLQVPATQIRRRRNLSDGTMMLDIDRQDLGDWIENFPSECSATTGSLVTGSRVVPQRRVLVYHPSRMPICR